MKTQHLQISGIKFINILSVILISLVMSFAFPSSSIADSDGHGGDGFRKTAMEYEAQSKKYTSKGKSDIAATYTRMAKIKRHAAKLADKGKWDDIDWSEYEKLDAKLNKMHKNKKY